MTQPDGYAPTGAANYSSLHDFASKTEDDWNDELTERETTRWGMPGIQGTFFQRWLDIRNAKAAADYANAQLAVRNRPIVDLFDGLAGNLSANWDKRTINIGGGGAQVDGSGSVSWDMFGGLDRGERYRWNLATTTGDDQVVSVVMPNTVQHNGILGGNSHFRVLGRVVDSGTINTFVYGEISDDAAEIGCYVGDSQTVFDSVTFDPADGDSWDFYLSGTDFTWQRNNVTVLSVSSSDGTGSASSGSGFRSVGFEMYAAGRAILFQTLPGSMAVFSADDYP